MPTERFHAALSSELDALRERGTLKGAESVITRVLPAEGERGPRYLLAGEGDKPFLKMNSNNYLGMALRPELVHAEEGASRSFGVGPGAVRFISGTYQAHVDLEARLAAFHGRESAMIFSSAYASVLGVLVPLDHGGDGGDQRRAEPQLHHQRHAPGPAQGQAGLQAPRLGGPGGEAGGRGRHLPAGAGRHRRHLQHAGGPRAAAGDRWLSPAAGTSGSRRTSW